jgi:myo-inositol catabolism protein IolC
MPRGYDRALYIQPFDHRGSFQTKLFGWKPPLTDAQTAEIAASKHVIYDGFQSALAAGVPKEKAGILVDEQFGAAILKQATAEHIVTACPAEKSGQKEFEFEYGEDFARHIEAFDPTFCKVLVRYNAEGDRALNQRQAARLKRLSDFLAAKNRSRFLFELLVPAEKAQLDKLKGDQKSYDLELRPSLMVEAIRELQDAGVDPDLWKVEGLDRNPPAEAAYACGVRRARIAHATGLTTGCETSSWVRRCHGSRSFEGRRAGAGRTRRSVGWSRRRWWRARPCTRSPSAMA